MDSYQKSNPRIFKYRTYPYFCTSNLFEIQTLICLLYEDVIRIELLCVICFFNKNFHIYMILVLNKVISCAFVLIELRVLL